MKFKDKFPEQYRILAEMNPQQLGGTVPAIELYDLTSDLDEMRNLAGEAKHRGELERLCAALKKWNADTHDTSVSLAELPAIK